MKFVMDCIRGILIGIANAIPGVSGGTMMVSMGIYDSIISSVTNLFHDFKKSVVTLLPYFIGMAAGIIGLSYAIKYLLGNFPFQTSMLFIGLILGGVPVLLGHISHKKMNASHFGVFVLFFVFILVLQVIGGEENAGTEMVLTITFLEVIKLFFVGVVAAATMVVPGVSGAMILMILGYYYPIIAQVTDFFHALIAFDMPAIMHSMAILVPFGTGVLLGIFVIAKIIEMLLQNFEAHTYSGILGLVIASPIVIIMSNGLPGLDLAVILTGALTFAAGFFVAKRLSD